jgi:gamma-glutamyl-gamma-aminobutyrate hydrolase PuuD
MKIVAISQRVDHFPKRNETRDALDQRLVTFLLVAGFIPVPVPNGFYKDLADGRSGLEALGVWLAVVKPQAFVLSGGNDIGQCRERDFTEGWLLDHASQHQKPLLGICRGMQMMAHWAGVDLCSVKGHIRTRHCLVGEIAGEVNSYHGFSLATCPVDFEVISRSEDGEIEAIRHQSLPWEGWMWHPEREGNFAARDLQRIKALFSG